MDHQLEFILGEKVLEPEAQPSIQSFKAITEQLQKNLVNNHQPSGRARLSLIMATTDEKYNAFRNSKAQNLFEDNPEVLEPRDLFEVNQKLKLIIETFEQQHKKGANLNNAFDKLLKYYSER